MNDRQTPAVWDDCEMECLSVPWNVTSGGREDGADIFRHGIRTAFNFIRKRFPPTRHHGDPAGGLPSRDLIISYMVLILATDWPAMRNYLYAAHAVIRRTGGGEPLRQLLDGWADAVQSET